jgi:predicted ATP-dependent serine protease
MELSYNMPVVCPIVIGRTTELTALHQLIDQARGGRGRLVLISGEAGVGKSRLVAESVPLHRLAQLMGHDSLDTTMIYIRATRSDLQKEVEQV